MRRRNEALERTAGNEFDVCVIGGGATGAGCALDAHLRGLKTALLEGADFASAASSASTKLVHGGVRYLEQAVRNLDAAEYRMVQRALRERIHMLRSAPHLAHPIEFLVPVFGWWQALYFGAGMKIYDWVSGQGRLFPSRFLTRKAAIRRMPALATERLRGAVAYADGQFDDSRYALALVESFAASGGEPLNYARVISFAKSPGGHLAAAEVEDRLTKRTFHVRAHVFVNATGTASDFVRHLATPSATPRLRPSKGVHILFPLDAFRGSDALLVPKTEDGRVIFAIPWLGRLLVGTTDDEATPESPMIVLRKEAEYLLRQLNPYLAKPLRIEQIVSGISGLRPLVAAAGTHDTKELIRDHDVEVDSASGLVSILGGKWTTHRLMAEETIDAVERSLGRAVTPCRTKDVLLAGAVGFSPNLWREFAREYGVGEATAQHVAEKFGTAGEKVLALTKREPKLKAPLVPGLPQVRAEVVFAIHDEMAVTIEDVLARRIGIQQLDWRAAIRAAPVVASHLAEELDWNINETQQEVADYAAKINGFLDALGLPPEPVPASDLLLNTSPQ